ncbi:MAG: gamma-butyrobetaine hydroxylase-like domain-containing protein [bacterium]|nr:gamma-butyrobetaine hydroxylase-like domain-containing protein [bacterium]
METVGGYAIRVSWKDGHNTGIYSWEYLKKLDKDQGNEKSQIYNDLL